MRLKAMPRTKLKNFCKNFYDENKLFLRLLVHPSSFPIIIKTNVGFGGGGEIKFRGVTYTNKVRVKVKIFKKLSRTTIIRYNMELYLVERGAE